MTKIKWIIILLALVALTAVSAFAYWKYQQANLRGEYFGPNPNNCKPGFPCFVEEDEGKKKVSDTPEVQALAKKYGGWEHVHIGALDIDLVRHTAFIEKIYPNLAKDTGCIIIAHAGDEGYVYREDKNLNIAYQETLAEFMKRTKDFDTEFMVKFYLSLH
ncbi:MAG: hypothetical protein AAB957_00490 [Patescibacteria group bacterium]